MNLVRVPEFWVLAWHTAGPPWRMRLSLRGPCQGFQVPCHVPCPAHYSLIAMTTTFQGMSGVRSRSRPQREVVLLASSSSAGILARAWPLHTNTAHSSVLGGVVSSQRRFMLPASGRTSQKTSAPSPQPYLYKASAGTWGVRCTLRRPVQSLRTASPTATSAAGFHRASCCRKRKTIWIFCWALRRPQLQPSSGS